MAKTLQELNLDDDFLFAKVMADKDICKKVLEKILNIEIERIDVLVSQNTIDNLLESKGVRLDVYVKDNIGTVFCCEMQTGKKRELPKRTRYYQGSIDLDLIAKGENYTNLKKSYVIFICTFDPFNKKRYYYTFKETCVEDTSLLLGDETTKIFLNTKGKVGELDDTLQEFLGYVEDSTDDYVKKSKSDLVKSLHKSVVTIKESKEMEVEYMTLLMREQDIRLDTREETLNIVNLYLSGHSATEISNILQIEDDVIEKVILSLKQNKVKK